MDSPLLKVQQFVGFVLGVIEGKEHTAKFYLPLRLLFDIVAITIWLVWSSIHYSTATHTICSPLITSEACDAKVTQGILLDTIYCVVLILFLAFIYILFFLLLALSSRTKKISVPTTQTWIIRFLVIHIYSCVVWSFYSYNYGTLLYSIVLFASMFLDAILIWRYVSCRATIRKGTTVNTSANNYRQGEQLVIE